MNIMLFPAKNGRVGIDIDNASQKIDLGEVVLSRIPADVAATA